MCIFFFFFTCVSCKQMCVGDTQEMQQLFCITPIHLKPNEGIGNLQDIRNRSIQRGVPLELLY